MNDHTELIQYIKNILNNDFENKYKNWKQVKSSNIFIEYYEFSVDPEKYHLGTFYMSLTFCKEKNYDIYHFTGARDIVYKGDNLKWLNQKCKTIDQAINYLLEFATIKDRYEEIYSELQKWLLKFV